MKQILLASFVGFIGGLIADLLGIFGSMLDYVLDLPIFMFIITFTVLYGVYHLISGRLLGLEKKKIKIVAIFMAIFTNPLWLVLINSSLFYPDYFSPPKSYSERMMECETMLTQQCVRCVSLDWIGKTEEAKNIENCVQNYWAYVYTHKDLETPLDFNECNGIKQICSKIVGIE